MSLTSLNDNINNNINAEIIAGEKVETFPGSGIWIQHGDLKLSAKNGTVNQNSLHSIIVNGDYSLDVIQFCKYRQS